MTKRCSWFPLKAAELSLLAWYSSVLCVPALSELGGKVEPSPLAPSCLWSLNISTWLPKAAISCMPGGMDYPGLSVAMKGAEANGKAFWLLYSGIFWKVKSLLYRWLKPTLGAPGRRLVGGSYATGTCPASPPGLMWPKCSSDLDRRGRERLG